MKQKSLPEDFRVEELTDFAPTEGPYAFYRLTKRGLGTPEAIQAILKRWRLSGRQVSYGGLKDRHAVTSQWLTIHRGPHRNLKQTNLELAYQGQAGRPFESHDVAGNRFQLVLRGLSDEEAARARRSLPEIEQFGVPNYFDQQRFGSVGQSGDFIARAWCAEDYERAIWLLLADPNPHDRPEQKAERQRVRQHWGNWERCAAQVHHSPWREVVAYLAAHPGNYGAAAEQIRPDLRSLYAAAFQSFLWNRALAALLREQCRAEQLADLSLAGQTVPFHRALDPRERAALASAELPLPSARIQLEEGPIKAIMDRVTAAAGLTWERLRIKHPRRTFFSKGQRPALVFVEELQQQTGEDELHRNRRKMTLTLKLPRGSYATIVIKRLLL